MRIPAKLVFNLFALVLQLSVLTAQAQDAVFEWGKRIGQAGNEIGYSITVDAAGNVYTTGRFSGTVDFDPGAATFDLTSAGSADVFISKLDADGNFVWAKNIGGVNDDDSFSIAVDAAGNVYTTGRFRGTADFDPSPATFNLTSTGINDAFISKLNNQGEFVWAKNLGGTLYSGGQAITVDAAGNVYTTGYFHETVDFDPGPGTFTLTSAGYSDIFISKLDTDGNFVWAKSMTGASAYDYSTSIVVDATGNVYTTGYFSSLVIDFDPGLATFNLSTTGSSDIFISKLDTDGNFVWAKNMGGTSSDQGNSIALDATGHIYITGFFNDTADFDPSPAAFNLTSEGSQDIFVSKLDTNGNFVWAKQIGGTNFENTNAMAVDATGDVYVIGNFYGTVDFDPGPATFTLSTTGGSDIFVSKLTTDGDFVWAKSMRGTSSNSVGYSIAVDVAGNAHTTGYFQGTVDFDPGACTYNLSSAGGYDIFVLKLRQGSSTPSITSFTPATGPVGTPVTITGTGFSGTPTNNEVKFFNNITATVTSSTATSINTTVPASSVTGKISVTVNCVTVQSATDFTVSVATAPTIISFTPASGPVGTTVTITGTNFSTTPASNIVAFNGTTAVVTASTTTSITTTVPSGATTGTITVTVSGNTATSATDFTVTVPAALTITTQPVNFPTCPGDIATFTTAATGTTNITYQWQIKFDGFFTDITDGNGYSGTSTSVFTINTNQNNGVGVFRCRINGDAAAQVLTNEVFITLKFNCNGNQPPVIEANTVATQVGGIVMLDLTSLISDPDDNLDISSLQLLSNVSEQGATASLNGMVLTLDYHGINFLGTDHVSLAVCDLLTECIQQEITIEVGGDVIIFNAVSPNGDGENDFFIIQYINILPATQSNKVTIYNRWGDVVFETSNYNNTDKIFKGISNNGKELPSGTYYYKIEFTGGRKTKTGYLSLKR